MNKTVKAIIVIVVLCTIGVFTVLCIKSSANTNSKLITVKVAQFGDVFIYVPLYLAEARGFFEEEGLKIELINTGGDDKTYAAIIGGSATFGVADPVFAAIAQEKGIKGRVIGGIVNGVPFSAITKKDIPQITDAKMLQQYSVATFSSPSTAYTVQKKMFQEAGLKPNIKQGAFGAMIPMLDAGQADIALELEPNVSTAILNGAKEVYSFSNIYPEFSFTGITTSNKIVEEDSALVQHFINAIAKAEAYAHRYPDSVAMFMSKRYPNIDFQIVQNAIKRMVESNTIPPNAVISPNAWNAAVKIRVEVGDLKSSSYAEDVMDMRFATNAITE